MCSSSSSHFEVMNEAKCFALRLQRLSADPNMVPLMTGMRHHCHRPSQRRPREPEDPRRISDGIMTSFLSAQSLQCKMDCILVQQRVPAFERQPLKNEHQQLVRKLEKL